MKQAELKRPAQAGRSFLFSEFRRHITGVLVGLARRRRVCWPDRRSFIPTSAQAALLSRRWTADWLIVASRRERSASGTRAETGVPPRRTPFGIKRCIFLRDPGFRQRTHNASGSSQQAPTAVAASQPAATTGPSPGIASKPRPAEDPLHRQRLLQSQHPCQRPQHDRRCHHHRGPPSCRRCTNCRNCWRRC